MEYRDVADGEEFVALSCEEVIRLISSDKLTVPSEEKVGFETNQNSLKQK